MELLKSAEHLMSLNQGNVDAVMKSGQIWAAGCQDMTKSLAAQAQTQFDSIVANFKALTSVKSLKEAVDLQTSLARSIFENAIAETSKMTSASIKLAEDAMAPISAHVALTVQTATRPTA